MSTKEIYQLRVVYGYDEDIYRVIRICGKNTLDDLSDIILDSFNFDHDHMYLFNMDMEPYGENSYELNHSKKEKSTNIALNKIIKEEEQMFLYLFDFGDEWVFAIIVENIKSGKCDKPKIIKSKGKLEQYPDEEDDYDEDF
jgi:hypothetical protein